MMAMTTRSSIRVKPAADDREKDLPGLRQGKALALGIIRFGFGIENNLSHAPELGNTKRNNSFANYARQENMIYSAAGPFTMSPPKT